MEKLQPLCTGVTHAFFTAYVHTDDFSELKNGNIPLFENFLTAIDTVAGDSLQNVCLQTGGKVSTPVYFVILLAGNLFEILQTALWSPSRTSSSPVERRYAAVRRQGSQLLL